MWASVGSRPTPLLRLVRVGSGWRQNSTGVDRNTSKFTSVFESRITVYTLLYGISSTYMVLQYEYPQFYQYIGIFEWAYLG